MIGTQWNLQAKREMMRINALLKTEM